LRMAVTKQGENGLSQTRTAVFVSGPVPGEQQPGLNRDTLLVRLPLLETGIYVKIVPYDDPRAEITLDHGLQISDSAPDGVVHGPYLDTARYDESTATSDCR